MCEEDRLTPQERAGVALDNLIKRPAGLSTTDLAAAVGLNRNSTLLMLRRLQRVLPALSYDYECRLWIYDPKK